MPKKSNRYDIISIGEAGLDTFVKINEASLLCNIDRDNCLMCLKYGDKITIDQMQETLAHNGCNVAVGSSRLGLSTALYTNIGDDDVGKKVLRLLEHENVSSEYVRVKRKSASNHSIVLNYQAERTILVHRQPHTYQLPLLNKTRWVYLTSLGAGFEKLHNQLLKQLKNNVFKLAFNPGDVQLKVGRAKLAPILKVCSLLIVNKQEAEILLEHKIEKDMLAAMRELRSYGPQIVVVTDGSKGAVGFDGGKLLHVKPMRAKLVEMTGAGDSFSTGLVAGLCYGKSLPVSLQWGSANAASVIEHIGPQAGLLTKARLLKRISSKKSS